METCKVKPPECKECGIELEGAEETQAAPRCYQCDKIRNQFAAAALSGNLTDAFASEEVAYMCFKIADALMEARKK